MIEYMDIYHYQSSLTQYVCIDFPDIELDQIIGCGHSQGNKYFLVRFKGEDKNEIIDWETAKQYSADVMEFFGSRTVWTEMQHIIDPDVHGELPDLERMGPVEDANRPSTSQLSQLDENPNEIEYDD